MGMLTPEQALKQFRAFDPSSGDMKRADFLANELFANYGDTEYGKKGYTPDSGGMLTPREQMQIEWIRADKGLNKGNNKDDRIKRIRQENNMDNELLGPGGKADRSIIRNKISKAGKADGMTSGDVFEIGDYTQSDTGKDDGMFQSAINKGLPGFDVGDITSFPGVDIIASLAAPYTGGASIAVLEGLKAAEAGKISVDNVLNTVAAMGGWDAVLDQLPPGMGEGFEIPEWAKDAYEAGKGVYEDVSQNPLIQQAQDIYGDVRDMTDPIEDIFGNVTDIFGDMDMGGLEDYLPDFNELIGTPPFNPQQGGYPVFQPPQTQPAQLLDLEYENTAGPLGPLPYNPFANG